MNTVNPAERLDLTRGEGTVVIDPSLAGTEISGERSPGDTEMPADEPAGCTCVRQLIGRYSDVIELLTDGEGDTIAVIETAATSREHGSLGPLPPSLLGPLIPLKQLELRSTDEDGQNSQGKAELHGGDARQRSGH